MCVGASILKQYVFFHLSFKDFKAKKKKKSTKLKNSKYIDCCSAVLESAQTPVEVEQSASSLPDFQYIVIHCTPAAGSQSPSPS